jgi:hypothetical protein
MPPPFLRPSYALPLRLINSEPHDTQAAAVLSECLLMARSGPIGSIAISSASALSGH